MESVIVSDSGVSDLFSTYTSSMHGNPDGPFHFRPVASLALHFPLASRRLVLSDYTRKVSFLQQSQYHLTQVDNQPPTRTIGGYQIPFFNGVIYSMHRYPLY